MLLDDDALHYILFYPMKDGRKNTKMSGAKEKKNKNSTRLACELAPAQLSHPSR